MNNNDFSEVLKDFLAGLRLRHQHPIIIFNVKILRCTLVAVEFVDRRHGWHTDSLSPLLMKSP